MMLKFKSSKLESPLLCLFCLFVWFGFLVVVGFIVVVF